MCEELQGVEHFTYNLLLLKILYIVGISLFILKTRWNSVRHKSHKEDIMLIIFLILVLSDVHGTFSALLLTSGLVI